MGSELKRPAGDLGPAEYRRLTANKLTGHKPALKMKKVWSIRPQPLPGHTKLESTARYLGVDVDDALEISTGVDL